jgi:hypothetical protein
LALSNETKAWLEGLQKEGNLNAEQLSAINTALEAAPKADEYVKGSVLRQADYSRNSAELQKAKAEAERTMVELQEKEKLVTKFQTELGTWKAGAEKSFSDAITAREAAEKKANAALSRLSSVATKFGVPAEELKLDEFMNTNTTTTTPTNNGVPANFDASQYITKADASKAVRETALLDAMLYDIGENHRELFGTRLPKPMELVQGALAAGKPLSQFWEETYKVGEKRTKISKAAIDKQIADGIQAGITKFTSENNLPNPTAAREDLHGSPVLVNGGIPKPSEDGRGGISAAIAAFQTGKYKQNFGNRT